MKNTKWQEVKFPFNPPPGITNCHAYRAPNGLKVTESIDTFLGSGDDRRWMHICVSRDDRYPSWDELRAVKEEFIGEEVEAYQVLPRKSEYVNDNPNCFHIWSCLDGPIMPQ